MTNKHRGPRLGDKAAQTAIKLALPILLGACAGPEMQTPQEPFENVVENGSEKKMNSEEHNGDDRTSVVLINPFTVPSDKLEQAIVLWEQGRDFLQKQPGYISTALHQSLQDNAQYRLVNVAKWKSMEAFNTANAKMRSAGVLSPVEGVSNSPALYTVIRR